MNTASQQIPYPSSVPLARTPTPLEQLKSTSERFGVELYIKRDDLTGAELTGNKARKLEFLLADALASGADTVITCGGEQSNHARATAIAGVRLGLQVRLLLRTRDPKNPPPPEGNILLNRLAGAEIVWITPKEYARRAEMLSSQATSFLKLGRIPYIIPEGGSNALGAWGYVRAVEELAHDLAALPGGAARPTTIIHATGSGGTTAGLILGVRLLGLNVRVIGINVCNNRDYFVRAIGKICETAIAAYGLGLTFSRERDIEILDGYVGHGYAKSRPVELSLLRDVVRTEGIVLDPVYTGKAFFGMTQELSREAKVFGERIVFLHTGGIFGLFPMAEQLASLP